MTRFASGEIAFDVPDDWEDRSSTSFVFAEAATSLTLTRADATPGLPLEAYEAALLAQLGASFPELEVVDRSAVQVAPATAGLRLTFEWTHPAARLRNVVTCVLADGALWSLTASTPTGALEATEHLIDRAMRSFTLAGVREDQCQVPMPTPKFW